jgi:hypothetical protein
MEKLRATTRPVKEVVTTDNFGVVSERLKTLIWQGNYKEALPLSDKVLEFQTKRGERDSALIQYASNYYAAAVRVWKEKGMRGAKEVGKYMNTALRALQERIENEIERERIKKKEEEEIEKQEGQKRGMIPVSLDALTSSELDVMQTVYRRAGEMADRIPLVKPLRQLVLSKESDPIRDFDAAALLAIRAGLKKVRAEKSGGIEPSPETEIFLRIGLFDIAKRYGWEGRARSRATEILNLAEIYPWPPDMSPEEVSRDMSAYGQAARVARHLRDIARQVGDDMRIQEFERKAQKYAAHIPDQKAKL